MNFPHSDEVIGHDCLPGRRDGIYVNAPREQPIGTGETCPMCGTRWTYRGEGQWDLQELIPEPGPPAAVPTGAG